nr:hypothetical protein [uncultured Methanoregula sp.]
MESLENRLGRLSPEQRREVEDFVDFLLSRTAPQPAALQVSPPVPPVLTAAPPLLAVQEPPSAHEPAAPALPSDTIEPPEPVITEITAGGDDWVTRDYMDYGKFEEEASPATEAIKKVKQKIIIKQEQEKPRQILDWID